MLEKLINNWLLGGADPEVGYRLFMDYCKPQIAIARIVGKNPLKYLSILKNSLLLKAGLPLEASAYYHSIAVGKNKTTQSFSLRSEWPFLADPECPPELKLIIADKITAYRDAAQAYEQMLDANTMEKQLKCVRALVSNFIANHEMYLELKHYKDNGTVLGNHIIFAQYKRIRELRDKTTMELFKKKKNLEHAIWRNESNIKKEKREDLNARRISKLKQLKIQLAEVNRLLA